MKIPSFDFHKLHAKYEEVKRERKDTYITVTGTIGKVGYYSMNRTATGSSAKRMDTLASVLMYIGDTDLGNYATWDEL